MNYLSDTMRVEMALPVHMMLAVLLCGANCADPGPMPSNRDPIALSQWRQAWAEHQKKRENDPDFARSYEEFVKTKELLIEACDEPVKDLLPKKRSSLLRRIEGLHHRLVEPYLKADSPDPRKIGLIAYYLISHLVETGYLIVPEESPFGQALDVMLPGLSPWEGSTEKEIEDYERLHRSAQKQFRHIVKALQGQGYYRDLVLAA